MRIFANNQSTLLLLLLILLPAFAFADETDGDEEAEGVCVVHEECRPGFYCEENLCTPLPEGECRKAADCSDPDNQYCDDDNFTCRYFCMEDHECSEGEYCDGETGMCEMIEGDQDDFCSDDADCEGGMYCDGRQHKCREFCQTHADCAEGEECISRRCEPIPPPEDGDTAEAADTNDTPPAVDGDEDSATEAAEAADTTDSIEETNHDNQNGAGGNVSDCLPGEICKDEEDAESEGSSGSDGCRKGGHVGGVVTLLFLLLIAIKARRKFTKE